VGDEAEELEAPGTSTSRVKFLLSQAGSSRRFAGVRVNVVENIPERAVVEAKAADDASVKLALQNFQSAMQGDDSLFDSRQRGNWQVTLAGDGREVCSGGFLLSFRGKELRLDRSLYFQLIQKLTGLLKNAGSPEVLAAKLCLLSERQGESLQGVLALRIELEAAGNSSEQAAVRWGLGVAHLQQALLFTSRYLRQQISQKSG
jgi:hypothetical protein